jgi:hypothetical protein
MWRAVVIVSLLAACGPPAAPPSTQPVPYPGPGRMPLPVPGPVPPPETPPTARPLREPFPTPPAAAPEQRVFSKRFQMGIVLPDRGGWVLRKERSRFLIFDHAASSSQLSLALWREDDNMSPASCEEKARLWRDLPRRGKAIDELQLGVPKGFASHAEVGFGDSKPGEPVHGYLLAFGAAARRCFAFAYATTAQGDGAERLVGDRLAVMRAVTLERLTLKSDLPP